MPPLNGEKHNSHAPSGSERLTATTALRPDQQVLFSVLEQAQPITWLAWLAGKLNLISHVQSPKAVYQAKDQHGDVHTRAWLTRDLADPDTISLLTDVVRVSNDRVHDLVPDSEQLQLTVKRDGAMATHAAHVLTRETTLTFIGDAQDTAELVGREVAQERISGTHYMAP